VIDRVDAGADRGFDAVGAVRVRGDLPSPPCCFFDGDAQLFFGVLLGAGRRAFRQDRTGRENLDEVGARLQIRSDRLADFVGAVGEVLTIGTST